MPINIYAENDGHTIAWLCDGEWRLLEQVDALRLWVDCHGDQLREGPYVADLGFCRRMDALGGGPVFDTSFMADLVGHGITLMLSEYPCDSDEDGMAAQQVDVPEPATNPVPDSPAFPAEVSRDR